MVMLLAVVGMQHVSAQVSSNTLTNFPSAYLAHEHLQDLMKAHFDVSIKQLLTSKQYGSQSMERPGMAKLLMEESNRHWDDAIDTLKEYLQIGGTVDTNFINDFRFTGKGELKMDGTEQPKMKYLDTLKEIMTTSRNFITELTNAHHVAVKRERPSVEAYGDAEVARFLLSQAEKESKMAHKMAIHCVNYNSVKNIGVAQDMFDEHL